MTGGLAEYLSMGGYAAYVWPAFGLAFVVLAALLVASRRRLRAGEAALKELEAQHPRRREGGQR
jgi:heme exporter protein D